MRSSDNGETWELPRSGTYRDLHDVTFSGEVDAFAVGNGGLILSSSDGGVTWEQSDPGIDSTLRHVIFPTSSVGFAIGLGALLRSNDGGDTWRALPPLPDSVTGIAFVDPDVGIATLSDGTIRRTMDGGEHWLVMREGSAGSVRNIAFTSDGRLGVAVGTGGLILLSSDSGATWTIREFPVAREVTAVSVTDDGRIAVGIRLPIGVGNPLYYSSDSGKTWLATSVPFASDYFAINDLLLDEIGRGIGVSNTGSIYTTDDHWETARPVTELWHESSGGYGVRLYRSANFATASVGIMPFFGLGGHCFRTTDGGVTWRRTQCGAIRAITPWFMTANNGVMLTERPEAVLETTDGGATWKGRSAVLEPKIGNAITGTFVDDRNGFMAGDVDPVGNPRGVFYKTSDGAYTFTAREFPEVTILSGVEFVSPAVGWISGVRRSDDADSVLFGYETGFLFRTTDGGETWTTVYRKYGRFAQVGALKFLNASHGLISVPGAEHGHPGKYVLLETTDSGNNWSVARVFDYGVADIAFLNDSLWIASGASASIWTTTDAGESWMRDEIDPVPMTMHRQPINFGEIELLPDLRTVMIFGYGAIVRKVFDEPVTGVPNETGHEIIPQLSVTPNPGRERVRLMLPPIRGEMRMRVTSTMGHLITEMAVSTVDTSREFIELDVSSFPSGIYQTHIIRSSGQVLGDATFIVVH